jgi:hypothetical protein
MYGPRRLSLHRFDSARGEPFVGNRLNSWAKRTRSEVASSVSGNRRLADNDAWMSLLRIYISLWLSQQSN